jgi:hypothetical protein
MDSGHSVGGHRSAASRLASVMDCLFEFPSLNHFFTTSAQAGPRRSLDRGLQHHAPLLGLVDAGIVYERLLAQAA